MDQYSKIASYLAYLKNTYHLEICIKDFYGFIPINKDLDAILQPYLAHTNPFCMYMKSDHKHYHICLSMIRKIYNKCKKQSTAFFGICHAGLGEYVIPITGKNLLLGTIHIGFFPVPEGKDTLRIIQACRKTPFIDSEKALYLYKKYIKLSSVDIHSLLPGLELLAEYLGQTYKVLQQTNPKLTNAVRYGNSNEDNILTHALGCIQQNYAGELSAKELAALCFCSESYLSRIFKKRTGIHIRAYINKIRIDAAKELLSNTNKNISEIAIQTGFNDPNYFSRIFAGTIGIPPREYRSRFQR